VNAAARFSLQVLAVDLGTVLAFATLHQVFIARAIGPYGAALFGIIPAIAVVLAWNGWGPDQPAAWKLGVGATICGALPWIVVFAVFWGTSEDPRGPTWSMAAALAAGILACGTAYASTRRAWTSAAAGSAVFLTFLFTGAFMLTTPVSWVDVRAFGCLAAGIVGGMAALAWTTRRMQATQEVPQPMVVPA
jgi:hypothetical protein